MKALYTFLIGIFAFFLFVPMSTAGFKDIPHHHIYYDAINFVQQRGIVMGYEDGTYRENKPINRAEFTKIIVYAAVGQEPIEHAGRCFPDVATGDWFYPYVCYAERMNIIGGYPDGTFQPANNIAFSEAAKIIVLGFGYSVDTSIKPWYKPYTDFLESKNAIPKSIDRFDKPLSRGEMAEIIYRLLKEDHGKAGGIIAEPGIKGYDDEKEIEEPTEANEENFVYSVTPLSRIDNNNLGSQLVALDNEWNLYTDFGLGFAMNIPKKVIWNTCEPDEESGPTNIVQGLVPLQGLADTDASYIGIQSHHIQLEDDTCHLYQFDLQKYKDQEVHTWKIQVWEAKNDDQLDAVVKEVYGDGCGIESKESAAEAGMMDIALTRTSPDEPEETRCFINWQTAIKYSPSAKKVAIWDMGQDASFVRENFDPYDQEMADSFRFE